MTPKEMEGVREIDKFERIDFHVNVIKKCTLEARHGLALLASLPGSRYPYCYPRDTGTCARFLRKVSTKSRDASLSLECLELLENIANFILHCQAEDGYWGQRYNASGEDHSIYKQEDNIAHGIIVLAEYILGALALGKKPRWRNELLEAIDRGANFALRNYYRPEINLFKTTTSIHESRIVQGFDIWTNFAYLRAFELAKRIMDQIGRTRMFSTIRAFHKQFEMRVLQIFTVMDRFVRRIDVTGHYDLRPDITLLSPFFFGMQGKAFKETEESVKIVESELWDPDLGGVERYLPYHEDFTCHLHAGSGPWMQYTAILAQYKYLNNDIKGGDEILESVKRHVSDGGFICEHLTTNLRFKEFMRNEWETGRDFEKEFDREILLPDVKFNFVVDELNHMRDSYLDIERQIHGQGKSRRGSSLKFATPLMWSHAEYGLALLAKYTSQKEGVSA